MSALRLAELPARHRLTAFGRLGQSGDRASGAVELSDAGLRALIERLLLASAIWFDQRLHVDLLRLVREIERLRAGEKAAA